jgi:hypothetical protein
VAFDELIEYRLRFLIALLGCELSYSFNRLLLAIAVATLWIYNIDEQVLQINTRAEIDPAFKRQLSVFQIGWRKLRRWITC